ncbi:hypothetical protein FA13DRAFT_1777273 [Coprinellus micaceus]|uniref:Uncharacterized protein n=1 Tax=Coprinellus micaceus TaxID=71717 RepID=A0A4Y7SVD9_COPMI|nr:hypothetical protein FA13DRAFT_1777273 [Coprinellus micaceus]
MQEVTKHDCQPKRSTFIWAELESDGRNKAQKSKSCHLNPLKRRGHFNNMRHEGSIPSPSYHSALTQGRVHTQRRSPTNIPGTWYRSRHPTAAGALQLLCISAWVQPGVGDSVRLPVSADTTPSIYGSGSSPASRLSVNEGGRRQALARRSVTTTPGVDHSAHGLQGDKLRSYLHEYVSMEEEEDVHFSTLVGRCTTPTPTRIVGHSVRCSSTQGQGPGISVDANLAVPPSDLKDHWTQH